MGNEGERACQAAQGRIGGHDAKKRLSAHERFDSLFQFGLRQEQQSVAFKQGIGVRPLHELKEVGAGLEGFGKRRGRGIRPLWAGAIDDDDDQVCTLWKSLVDGELALAPGQPRRNQLAAVGGQCKVGRGIVRRKAGQAEERRHDQPRKPAADLDQVDD